MTHHYKGYKIVIDHEGYETFKDGEFKFSYDGPEPEAQLLEMAKADIDDENMMVAA